MTTFLKNRDMKFSFHLLLTCIALTACGESGKTTADYRIVPRPGEIAPGDGGDFELDARTRIVCTGDGDGMRANAEFLAGYVESVVGSAPEITGPDGLCDDGRAVILRADAPREEWLAVRNTGIGGSDAAAILGISPWRTARDLYYDKLNVVKADMDENWVALEMGHLLEDLVARIFAKKTGLRIFQRKVMFQHPLYPWMLADLDYLVELPDGSNAILEIKTTNYNARENWWYNGEEIVPVYYESQGRHYMSVMNLDRVYFCCLYGNNEDEVIIRHLDRDYAYESELIALEDAFWNDHVQKQCPPDYTESGDLILQSLQRWKGIDRKDLPPAAFGAPQVTQIHQYLQLQEQKNALAKQVTQLDVQMQQLKGLLVSELDGKDCATCADGDQSYVISYNPIRRQGISKDNMIRLREVYPEIYEQFVETSESRRFSIKIAAQPAA